MHYHLVLPGLFSVLTGGHCSFLGKSWQWYPILYMNCIPRAGCRRKLTLILFAVSLMAHLISAVQFSLMFLSNSDCICGLFSLANLVQPWTWLSQTRNTLAPSSNMQLAFRKGKRHSSSWWWLCPEQTQAPVTSQLAGCHLPVSQTSGPGEAVEPGLGAMRTGGAQGFGSMECPLSLEILGKALEKPDQSWTGSRKQKELHMVIFVCVCVCGTVAWTQGLHLEPFHQPFFVMSFFETASHKLFAWAGFEPRSSWSLLPE
jgi:hypothetical protein